MKNLNKTFIIAEAGVNHNGDMRLAKKMIDVARRAGADAIKFQSFKASRLVSKGAPKADYQKKTTQASESQYEMIKKLELSEKNHIRLIDHCKKRNIMFISSPFDHESVDLLYRLKVKTFKIPSGEITNEPLLKHVARKMKPIILSTGMSTLLEVKNALAWLYSQGNKQVTLLHCVTEYPSPVEDVNLLAMQTLKKAFNVPVGYSDHTPGFEIAITAVAMGAAVIEKHFTLDSTMEGPDHKASLEPDAFAQMVRAIRNVEQALGSGLKRPARSEMKNINIARKSLVAANNILKGHIMTERDLLIKRPGNGIQPGEMEKVIGRKSRVSIKKDEVIVWEQLA